MSKMDDMKIKMTAVELLGVLKRNYTYKDLSEMLNLSSTVLSRYVNGHVFPNLRRAEGIVSLFKEKYLQEIVSRRLTSRYDGAIDTSLIVSDAPLLRLIGKIVFNEFNFLHVDTILTMESDGIPLAVQVANEFGIPIVVAKKEKDVGIQEFVEERCVRSPAVVQYLYIPRGSFKHGDDIFIVDDLIRTGLTAEALVKMVEKSKARVVGIFTIASIGGAIERIQKRLNLTCPIKTLAKLGK